MIYFRAVTSGSSIANGPYVTASNTPTSGALQLLAVVARVAAAVDPDVPTCTGNGLTWVLVRSVVFSATPGSTRKRLALFQASGPQPTTGSQTVTFGASTTSEGEWSLVEVSGARENTPIIQSAQNNRDDAAAATLTVTLGAFADSGNATYGAFAADIAGGMAAEAGHTLLHSVSGSVLSIGSESLISSDTSVTMTSSGGSAGMGGIAIELAPLFKGMRGFLPDLRSIGTRALLNPLAW